MTTNKTPKTPVSDYINEHRGSVIALARCNRLREISDGVPTEATPIRIGPYRIHFSGFMQTEVGDCLIGNWFAWPSVEWISLRPNEDTRYFVASVPGSQREYRPGGNYPVDRIFTFAEFDSKGGSAKARQMIWDGQCRLLKLLAESGELR